jgi:glucuronokinase
MQIIRQRAYARAGLLGNPSDGYHGKTISFIVRDFCAEVVLYEWDEVELVWSGEDQNRFRTVHDLSRDVKRHGYYGGVRLVKATIKKFVEFCARQGISLHERNFSVRYQSNIPRQVGLAGSSAIIIATLRGLMEFYGVSIAREALPSLARSVETEELGIAAGLQDRVIQVYEGLVYMDFARQHGRETGGLWHGIYEPLNTHLLPPLYLAYKTEVSEPTEVFHNQVRSRFEDGEPAVMRVMERFAALAAEGRDALIQRDRKRLANLIDENFDTRRAIFQLPAEHIAMVEQARDAGASAKFAGSGGAIIGTYDDESIFQRVAAKLEAMGCRVIRPRIEPLPPAKPDC